MADRSSTPSRTERKRERTRRELLEAGREVLAEKGASLTIRDVTTAADVAVGTFYNYFQDPDDLIDAVMREELLTIMASAAGEQTTDPAERIAQTTVRVLDRAIGDPAWGRLALRLVHRPGEPNQLNGYLRDDLDEGRAQARFEFGADDATLDLATGLLVMSLRRIVAGAAGREVVAPVVERLLRALGIEADEAAVIARRAAA